MALPPQSSSQLPGGFDSVGVVERRVQGMPVCEEGCVEKGSWEEGRESHQAALRVGVCCHSSQSQENPVTDVGSPVSA